MQVRRRPFPLDFQTLASVRAGKRPDPRKGPKEGRGSHSPKMRKGSTLFVGGISYEVVLEEREKARAERDPRTVKIVSSDRSTTRIVPFARYGREAAKLRAAGFKVPYGDAVSPGVTVQIS